MTNLVLNHEAGLLNESLDAAKAKEAAKILEDTYPGHPWRVDYRGHMLMVQHAEIDDYIQIMGRFAKGFCYSINWQQYTDAKVFKAEVKEAGGKLLEAFGLPRGKWVGLPCQFPFGLFSQKVGVLQNGD
jgi:hypothetical protein